jgi:hypothetical protein
MALTPELKVSGVRVRAIASGGNLDLTSFLVRTVVNYPSEDVWVTGIRTRAVVSYPTNTILTGIRVRAVVRGRIASPRLRAWTFTLDGHDFYVLRLGDTLTLVYDVYSEQWMEWADLDKSYWRPNLGINWTGGDGLAPVYGSNVLVGDDTFGLLWFLDPEQPYDEHPDELNPVQEIYFDRIVMGQMMVKGRETMPVYAAWLTTDMGAPAYTGAGVTLEISDDAGVSFFDCGTIEVTLDTNSPELSWYSLGLITAPGRLFKITDDGAITRIDSLVVNDPDDGG